jgi:hypothetical protein
MSPEWLRGWPRGNKEMMYVCHFLVLVGAVFFVNKILAVLILFFTITTFLCPSSAF